MEAENKILTHMPDAAGCAICKEFRFLKANLLDCRILIN